MNVNKIFLGGNLTRDPELRYGQSGKSYAKFGMAVNETYTTSGGEKRENTVFVDLTAFGRTAEVIAEYLKKGDPIFVEGKLDFSTWQDKATGANRSKLSVIVNSFQFVGTRSDVAGGTTSSGETISDSGIRQDPPATDVVPF